MLLCEVRCIRIYFTQSNYLHVYHNHHLFSRFVKWNGYTEWCYVLSKLSIIGTSPAHQSKTAQMKKLFHKFVWSEATFSPKFPLHIALSNGTCNCILFQTIDEHNICQKRMLFTLFIKDEIANGSVLLKKKPKITGCLLYNISRDIVFIIDLNSLK